jgi:hypothetical protein
MWMTLYGGHSSIESADSKVNGGVGSKVRASRPFIRCHRLIKTLPNIPGFEFQIIAA